jgi:hypothetical protein
MTDMSIGPNYPVRMFCGRRDFFGHWEVWIPCQDNPNAIWFHLSARHIHLANHAKI